MSEWRSIETAPKTQTINGHEIYPGPTILLASNFHHYAVGYWNMTDDGVGGWHSLHDHSVIDYWSPLTHWMPLPEPPALSRGR